jgi:uncharacterized protein (TIGR02246 family)
MAKEELLWTAWGKRDTETFKKNLTGDAVQIGPSGAYSGRESILQAMGRQSCNFTDFDPENVEMRQLSKDVIVLSYAYAQKGTCNGDPIPARVMATSIYVQKDGRWLAAHYHESPLD